MKAKELIPPVLTQLYHRMTSSDRLYYFGSFKTWNEACDAAKRYGGAYEAENIIKKVADSTQVVREGGAAYEQDGVLFYEDDNIYELLSTLFYIATNSSRIDICDIGGSLGSTFFRYRSILPMERMSWSIVEQKHFVDYGKSNIPEIDFYYSVEECFEKKDKINVVLLSGTLMYIDYPYIMLDKVFRGGPQYVILDETAFNVCEDLDEEIVLQHVPASIYEAVYPSHIFNSQKLIDHFENSGYRKVFEWVYPRGAIPTRKGLGFRENIDKGFLFELV